MSSPGFTVFAKTGTAQEGFLETPFRVRPPAISCSSPSAEPETNVLMCLRLRRLLEANASLFNPSFQPPTNEEIIGDRGFAPGFRIQHFLIPVLGCIILAGCVLRDAGPPWSLQDLHARGFKLLRISVQPEQRGSREPGLCGM